MPGGIVLLQSDPSLIPTPGANHDTLFIDSTASPNPAPAYKDPSGVTRPLIGATGSQGPVGPMFPIEDGLEGEGGIGVPGPAGPQGPAGSAASGVQTLRNLWAQAQAGTTSQDTFSGPWSAPTGSPADDTDNNHGFIAYTTAATTGSSARVITNAAIFRPDHLPTFYVIIRTGSVITSIRMWFGLLNSSVFPDEDTLTNKGVLFRYSTVAADGGWVGVCGDGTQSVTGTVATIAASTIYILKIRVASASSVFFSVNGGTEVQATTHIPTGINLRLIGGIVTEENVAKTWSFCKIYAEGN